jgi:hypothetical protein
LGERTNLGDDLHFGEGAVEEFGDLSAVKAGRQIADVELSLMLVLKDGRAFDRVDFSCLREVRRG